MIMRYGKGRGRGDNNFGEKNGPISSKLMRILEKYTYTSNGPYPGVENLSRAIRKKGHNIRARLKGLAMVYIYQ